MIRIEKRVLVAVFALVFSLSLRAEEPNVISMEQTPIDLKARILGKRNGPPPRLFDTREYVGNFALDKLETMRSAGQLQPLGSKMILGTRVVNIDYHALGADFRNGAGQARINGRVVQYDWVIGNTVIVSPFEGLDYEVTNTRISAVEGEASWYWEGSIKDVPGGELWMWIDDITGNINGTIFAYDRRFQIKPLPDSSLHVIQEIDMSKIAPRDGISKEQWSELLEKLKDPSLSKSDLLIDEMQRYAKVIFNKVLHLVEQPAYAAVPFPVVVDIKVWRTSEVSSSLASTNVGQIRTNLQSLISKSKVSNLTVNVTNAGLLVGATTLDEFTIIYAQLIGPSGILSGATNALRGTADLGVLLVDDLTKGGISACGAAIPYDTPLLPVNKEFIWLALVPTSNTGGCNLDLLRGPHELGHMFGMHHEDCNDAAGYASSLCETGQKPFKYSNGYQQSNPILQSKFRTVQAVANSNPPLPEVPYWSNPNVTPTGMSRKSGVTDKSDNARTMRLTAIEVSGYRGAGTSNEPGEPDALIVQNLFCNSNLVQITDDQSQYVEKYELQGSGDPTFLNAFTVYDGNLLDCLFNILVPNIWYRVRACVFGNCSGWVIGNQPASVSDCGGF